MSRSDTNDELKSTPKNEKTAVAPQQGARPMQVAIRTGIKAGIIIERPGR